MLTALRVAGDEAIRSRLQLVLERNVFEVAAVAGLKDALMRIAKENVDGRLFQLGMSHSGVQADELFVKPIETASFGKLACEEISHAEASGSPFQASAASIFEHELDATIQYWMEIGKRDEELTCIPLSFEDRTSHLPNLLTDLAKLTPPLHCESRHLPSRTRTRRSATCTANTTIRLRYRHAWGKATDMTRNGAGWAMVFVRTLPEAKVLLVKDYSAEAGLHDAVAYYDLRRSMTPDERRIHLVIPILG
jgi:hypothetical protein